MTLERERLTGLERDNAALMAEVTSRLRDQQERERELALALRAGGFGTWSFELASKTLTSSEECKALFGRDPELPFTYDERIAAIHPDDRQRAIEGMEEAGGLRREHNEEYRVFWPDGSMHWLSSRGQPFFDSDGHPVRVAGVSMDITDAKRAELKRHALARLNDLFRDLDHSADISYVAAQVIGETLGVRRAGYGVVDPVTETVTIERDWYPPDGSSIAGTLQFRDYGSYIEDMRRGETVNIEDTRLDSRTAASTSTLEAIEARSFINMPLTEQGKFVAVIFFNDAVPRRWLDDELDFVREVAERTRAASERRRAERELAELAASLEQQVTERTAELVVAEDALRQSQKMEAVGQLTGGLAHDFNNLLTGISGSLEMIQLRLAQGRETDVNRYVDAAQGASRRAAALTHRLLAFRRRQTLDPRPTDANALIAGMKELIRRTVGPSVAVETSLAHDLSSTLVDPSQLENALLNLCINARDAMPDGGRIMIETRDRLVDARSGRERDLEPGAYVVLGGQRHRFRHDPGGDRQGVRALLHDEADRQGTGLGLSMIYGFARQSGGQVRIDSELGEGTTVRSTFPDRGDAAEPIVEPRARRAPRARATARRCWWWTTSRACACSSSRCWATRLRRAGGRRGPSAMRILESDARIDLLVTDVGLPGG